MNDGKKVEKKKTSTKQKTSNPVYNESFIFNVPNERINSTGFSVSVVDRVHHGRNELVGQLLIGATSKTGPMEEKHWKEMMDRPRQQVAQWHTLKRKL